MTTNIELMKESLTNCISYYKNEYELASELSAPYCEQKRRTIEEAATSFIEGVQLATLYLIDEEAKEKITEFINDMELEFIKAHTLTGVSID